MKNNYISGIYQRIKFKSILGKARNNKFYRSLFLINFTCSTVSTTFMGIGGMFITAYALFLGIDASQLGIISAFSVLTNVLQLFSPYILSKYHSRKILLITLLVAKNLSYIPIIFIPILGLGNQRYFLLAGFLILSNSFSAIMGGGLIDWNDRFVAKKSKGAYYSNRNMIGNVLGVANSVIIGTILTTFSQKYIMYITVFCVIILMATCEILILTFIPEPVVLNRSSYKFKRMLDPFKDKIFNKFIIFGCIWGFSQQMSQPFYTIYAVTQMKYSYALIGMAASIASFSKTFVARPCGRIGDKFGWSKIFLITGSAYPLTNLLKAFLTPETKLLYIIIIIINGLSMICINICIFNVPIFLTNTENRLTYFAIKATCSAVFSFAGSFVGALLIRKMGDMIIPIININSYKLLFITTGILGASVAVYFSFIFRKFEFKETISSIEK